MCASSKFDERAKDETVLLITPISPFKTIREGMDMPIRGIISVQGQFIRVSTTLFSLFFGYRRSFNKPGHAGKLHVKSDMIF